MGPTESIERKTDTKKISQKRRESIRRNPQEYSLKKKRKSNKRKTPEGAPEYGVKKDKKRREVRKPYREEQSQKKFDPSNLKQRQRKENQRQGKKSK